MATEINRDLIAKEIEKITAAMNVAIKNRVTSLGQPIQHTLTKYDIEHLKLGYYAFDVSPDFITEEQKDALNRLSTEWGKCRDEWRSAAESYHVSWLLHLMTWDGKPYLQVNKDKKIEPINLPGTAPEDYRYFNVQRGRPLLLPLISELSHTGVIFEAQPMSSSIDDVSASRIATKIIRHYENRNDVKQIKSDLAHRLVLTGNAFIYVSWDDSLSAVFMNEKGEKESRRSGNVVIEVVPPECVYVAPGTKCLDTADKFIIERSRSLQWIIEHYPDFVGILKPDAVYTGTGDLLNATGSRAVASYWNNSQWTNRFISNQLMDDNPNWNNLSITYGSSPTPAEPFVVTECFEKFESEHGPILWRTVICQGVVLDDGPYAPTKDGKLYKSESGTVMCYPNPLVFFKYYTQPNDFWGRGVVRDVLPLLRTLWNYDAIIAKQMADASQVRVIRQESEPSQHIVNRGVQEFLYKRTPPQVVPAFNVSSQIIGVVEYYENLMAEVTAQPKVLRGVNQSPRDSAAKIEYLGQQAMSAFTSIKVNTVICWAKVYEKVLQILQVNADEKIFLGFDINDLSGVIAFTGADLRNHTSVTIRLDSIWGAAKGERIAIAERFLQMGVITRDQFMQLVNASGSEEQVDDLERQQRAAERILDTVRNIPEEQASKFLAVLAQAIGVARQQAEQVPAFVDNPLKLTKLLHEITIEVLYLLGIRLDKPYYNFDQMMPVLIRFGLSIQEELMPEPNRILLETVYKTMATQRGIVELDAQIAQIDAQIAARAEQQLMADQAAAGQPVPMQQAPVAVPPRGTQNMPMR